MLIQSSGHIRQLKNNPKRRRLKLHQRPEQPRPNLVRIPYLLDQPIYSHLLSHLLHSDEKVLDSDDPSDPTVYLHQGDIQMAINCGESQGFMMWAVLRAVTDEATWCVDAKELVEEALTIGDARYRMKKFAESSFIANLSRNPRRPWEDPKGRTWLRNPNAAREEMDRRHPGCFVPRGKRIRIKLSVLLSRITTKQMAAAAVSIGRAEKPTSHATFKHKGIGRTVLKNAINRLDGAKSTNWVYVASCSGETVPGCAWVQVGCEKRISHPFARRAIKPVFRPGLGWVVQLPNTVSFTGKVAEATKDIRQSSSSYRSLGHARKNYYVKANALIRNDDTLLVQIGPVKFGMLWGVRTASWS